MRNDSDVGFFDAALARWKSIFRWCIRMQLAARGWGHLGQWKAYGQLIKPCLLLRGKSGLLGGSP